MNKEIDGDIWDIVADVGFILYDLGEMAYDYSTTGEVDPISVAALSADVTMLFVPIGTGGGLAVRASAKGTKTVVKKVTTEAVEEGAEKIVIKNNNARQLLEKRGLSKQDAKDVVGSFDGDITLTKGKKGDVFDITESSKGAASGNYVTRGSAGKTPAERIDNLALPPNNTAKRTGKVELGRDQNLLEGKVKENFGKPGGGHQVVTDGGRKTGAVKDID